MTKVFQYGSNCDSERFNHSTRLGGVATNPMKAQTVGDYDLVFDVWSEGNKCAAADLVRRNGRKAWGILYDVPDDRVDGKGIGKLKTLAQIEDSRYQRTIIPVNCNGKTIEAVTFLVKEDKRVNTKATSFAYVEHIVRGLRHYQVPEDYINHVIDTAITNLRAVSSSAKDQIAEVEALRNT